MLLLIQYPRGRNKLKTKMTRWNSLVDLRNILYHWYITIGSFKLCTPVLFGFYLKYHTEWMKSILKRYIHKKLKIIPHSFFWRQQKTIDVDKHLQFKLWQTSNLMSLRRQRIRENILNIFNRLNFWTFAIWIHVHYWYDIVWWRKINVSMERLSKTLISL